MRHALAYETVGLCQVCEEPLTSREVLETNQARLCPDCWAVGRRQSLRQTESFSVNVR